MKKILTVACLFAFFTALGQNALRLNLDAEGKTYIKGSLRANFWARYYQTNPNSTMNNEPINEISDISIRRLRIGFEAQITPKLFFYSVFGNNDINSVTQRGVRFDPLDMYAQYSFAPEFAIGFGEIGWGSSRGAMRSSKSMMGLDAPLFSLFNVNKNDDLARSLGVFAKGNAGRWHYVVAVKNPLKMTNAPREGIVGYAQNAPRKQYSAYLKYDFFDIEGTNNTYSYGVGTYVGAKKVFNLAAGSTFQSKMMSELVGGVPKYYDYKNISVEAFLDMPLSEKNDAITMYLGYFHTDYGRNYIRQVGANDLADDVPTPSHYSRSGNDFPMMGTGTTLFFQGGYLLPKSERFSSRIQPHLSWQYSLFDGLKKPMSVYDLGVNVFFKKHDRKLTLSYQSRPIYDLNTEVSSRKGMFVLQYQVEIN